VGQREGWKSRVGFTFAAVGSAVGLANIWKFPYIVGQNGGAAFIAVYLICLLLIGFPVLISEILIGRATQRNPATALKKIGKKRYWGFAGWIILMTGFVVSSFYSVVAGWVLGYLIEAARGNLTVFTSSADAVSHFDSLMLSPWWGLSFHFCFITLCVFVLYKGVRKGIEKGTTILMPVLLLVLFILVGKSLLLPGAAKGLRFLFSPDWSLLTPLAVLTALGHSFFTLSVGQGTMITYGSYLSKEENVPGSCWPIALIDTVISLLAAVVVFCIVFSADMEPAAGPALIFQTLPYVFSLIPGGYFFAIFFFLLLALAALTSEISAMEPLISYLIDEKGWTRKKGVLFCGAGAFLLGVPSALSMNLLSEYKIFGMTFFGMVDYVCTNVMIPLGGLVAVIVVGWVWGIRGAMENLKKGTGVLFTRLPWLKVYFSFCFKYCSPILIVIVFLHALGIF